MTKIDRGVQKMKLKMKELMIFVTHFQTTVTDRMRPFRNKCRLRCIYLCISCIQYCWICDNTLLKFVHARQHVGIRDRL